MWNNKRSNVRRSKLTTVGSCVSVRCCVLTESSVAVAVENFVSWSGSCDAVNTRRCQRCRTICTVDSSSFSRWISSAFSHYFTMTPFTNISVSAPLDDWITYNNVTSFTLTYTCRVDCMPGPFITWTLPPSLHDPALITGQFGHKLWKHLCPVTPILMRALATA